MSEYKVGDKVRFVKDIGRVKAGTEGTIWQQTLHPFDFRVSLSEKYDDWIAVHESEIEPATPREVTEETRTNVFWRSPHSSGWYLAYDSEVDAHLAAGREVKRVTTHRRVETEYLHDTPTDS